MKYQSLFLAGMAVIGALIATPSVAQIPVTDLAHIETSVSNHIESIAKYVEQIGQLKSQLDQMKQQYNALTGSRNLGAILNDAKYKDYLPDDWKGVYDSVRSGGYSSLSSSAKSLYDASKKYDACARVKDDTARVSCQARAVKGAQDKAFAMDAFDKSKNRLDQIQSLMTQINSTDDPKSIAELQGRIAAEQAMIQNEQTKLQMFQMIAAAEEQLQRQEQREINAKANARRGYVTAPAVTF